MAGARRRRKKQGRGVDSARIYRMVRSLPLLPWAWKACVLALLLLAVGTAGYLVGREDRGVSEVKRGNETRTAAPAPEQRPSAAPHAPKPEARTAVREEFLPPARSTVPRPPAPERRADPPPETPPETLPPAKPSGTLAWQRNAVPARDPGGRPMIAIVLDDVGVNRAQAKKAIALSGPVTLSFMTYADDLPELTAAARAAGHELMLHVPMEPMEMRVSPGPHALMLGLGEAELTRRLSWGLARFDGYVGINNHMGSRFTRDERGMATVMAQLKARGLLFLDSLTTPDSAGMTAAAQAGVPHVGRDVFLDHVQTRDAVRASLGKLEERARARGHAIGIGHPHQETLDVLRPWLASLEERGFVLVPVSAIVKRQAQAESRAAAARVHPAAIVR